MLCSGILSKEEVTSILKQALQTHEGRIALLHAMHFNDIHNKQTALEFLDRYEDMVIFDGLVFPEDMVENFNPTYKEWGVEKGFAKEALRLENYERSIKSRFDILDW